MGSVTPLTLSLGLAFLEWAMSGDMKIRILRNITQHLR